MRPEPSHSSGMELLPGLILGLPGNGKTSSLQSFFDMSLYRYAAYGSNLHPIRLQKRIPSARLIGTSLLSRHELRFHKVSDNDGSGKCSVVPGGSGVYLAIFEIPESDRVILDAIEGLNSGYNEITFETEIFGRCSSYIADSSVIDETKCPFDWYKEMVLLGCLANNFPIAYVQQVESVSTTIDENGERASRAWQIVEELRNAKRFRASS